MDRDAGPESEIRIVADWHDALNAGDVDRLLGLSHPEVEMGGPRGTIYGTQILREWVDGAGIRLVTRRVFHASETVVVEQEASWTSADTGGTTQPQTVASVFAVRDGQVTSVVRHENLDQAMNAAGLDESHLAEDG